MNQKPLIKFLHAVKNAWRESSSEEAQDRAAKLSLILDNGPLNVVSEEWKSDMKCEPPHDIKVNLQHSPEG